MRRLIVLALCVATILILCVSAGAVTGISSMTSQITVSSDSSCQVTSTVTIHLDSPMEEIVFPVPRDAAAVTLNGSRVLTHAKGEVKNIDLSKILKGMAGDFTFVVGYRLTDLVSTNEAELLQLTLPLLSGFAYPVQHMEVSVSMPGSIYTQPGFTSGYHQANIEKDLSFHVDGFTILCRAQSTLKDHETLAMTLIVSEEMFPQSIIQSPDLNISNTAAIVCVVLAGFYWIVFLRFLLPLPQKRTVPPEGFSAGQMESVLHLRGADLTLMVLSWAQLGYVMIHQNRQGQVRLYKQMEMDNERSSFERRCFSSLFSKKDVVDTASSHYVQLYMSIASAKPNVQSFVKKGSGNVNIFRFLTNLIGLACGTGLGITLGAEAAAGWLVVFIWTVFGFLSHRYMSQWAYSLLKQDKHRIWISLALVGVWLLLGLLSGQISLALWAVVSAAASGLMSAFGGRRTPEGRQAMAQIFGLRRYLVSVSSQDIQRICRNNPEYFHDLAPYALALNADKRFARSFGGEKIHCPYITESNELYLTAAQWSEYMRLTVDTMNARIQRQPLEKCRRILRSLIK